MVPSGCVIFAPVERFYQRAASPPKTPLLPLAPVCLMRPNERGVASGSDGR